MRIAIVHDWLTVYAGAERVLEQMLVVYPDADIFSLIDFVPEKQRSFIGARQVNTSFLQKMPFLKKKYRNFLPLMPYAIEQFDLSGYDLIISSSHAVAKGVLTGPDQLHVCMCYSPIRYAWDLQHQYLKESKLDKGLKGIVARYLLHKIRIWDYRTANGVDEFIAISDFISRRIKKVYGRESTVIYPPVNVADFSLKKEKEEFYLTASRLVPYKKIDLIVEAFSRESDKKLVVIGDGPDMDKVKTKAGPNVEILGHQPFATLCDYMQRANAFVFAAEEDFGIVPLEAQACGTPVIAYGKGGALETIKGAETECPTGQFFEKQNIESIIAAVDRFEGGREQFSAENCRQNALRFSPERFREEFKVFIEDAVKRFNAGS